MALQKRNWWSILHIFIYRYNIYIYRVTDVQRRIECDQAMPQKVAADICQWSWSMVESRGGLGKAQASEGRCSWKDTIIWWSWWMLEAGEVSRFLSGFLGFCHGFRRNNRKCMITVNINQCDHIISWYLENLVTKKTGNWPKLQEMVATAVQYKCISHTILTSCCKMWSTWGV